MKKIRKSANPFYVVLVVAGIAFALTACAYGVMMVRLIEPPAVDAAPQSGLVAFMDRHGLRVMSAELTVLAVATFGAIATDQFWHARAARAPCPPDPMREHGDVP